METWKAIIGYEGLYEISNMGRVRSVARTIVYSNGTLHKYNQYILKLQVKRDGYVRAILCSNGKEQHCYVHRLVALHFIPNPHCKETVNHRSGDKQDNRWFRLQWNTHSENNMHAVASKLRVPMKGERVNGAKLSETDVLNIRQLFTLGSYTQAQLSKMYSVTIGNINSIVHNKSWTHI